jgi:fucose 4-O-acetylase-like acetyltransferase
VVLGHTLRGLRATHILPDSGMPLQIDRFVYAFHMPLFFLLAGLFLPKSLDRPFREYVGDRFARLGYPYIIWAPLQTVLQIVGSRFTNHPQQPSDLWRIVYAPPMQFWFLYVLLVLVLLVYALWRLRIGRLGVLLAATATLATTDRVTLLDWDVWFMARASFIYLAVGMVIGTPRARRLWMQLPTPMAAVVALLGFAAVALTARTDGLEAHSALARSMAFVGVAATLALSQLPFPGSLRVALRYLGQQSLVIFVAHTIVSAVARIVLLSVLHVHGPTIHIVLAMSLGVVAPLVLDHFCKRFGISAFEYPRRARGT